MSQFYRNNRFNDRSRGRNFRRNSFQPKHAGSKIIAEIMARKQVNTFVDTSTEGKQVIKNSFHDFAISDILKKNIISKRYENPTPIQDQAIPVILNGKD